MVDFKKDAKKLGHKAEHMGEEAKDKLKHMKPGSKKKGQ